MTQFFNRLFSVRSGEWKLVLLMQLQIFLIIAILLVVKPIAGAWFIEAYGADALPFIFIATALFAGWVSWVYAKARKKLGLLALNLGSLGSSMVLLVLLLLARYIPGAQRIVAAGLYLWMALFGLLASSQFWMLANFLFDIRQAKRLFGFIGAGAISGGIVGGYLTSLFARQYGADLLLLGAALALIPCMFISVYVWKKYGAPRQRLHKEKKEEEQQNGAWNTISSSRHLLLICAILILSVMVAKLVDYQFSALAALRFSDPDELAAFFGFWFSSFNVIALFLQLLVTQRVLRLFSVSGTLLFLPAGLGAGAVIMLILPGLPAAILSRMADGSFKQSLNRAATELLFLPLSTEVKRQVKTYIDVFVDSLAGGLGGLLLILLIDGLKLSPYTISWPVIGLVGLWLFCVVLIREEYMDAFRSQLKDLQPRRRSPYLGSYQKELLNNFLKTLRASKIEEEEDQLFYVLERSERLNDPRFLEPLTRLLEHDSPAVRVRALQSLYRYNGHKLDGQILLLLYDPSEEVRVAAADCLMVQELQRQAQGKTDELLSQQLIDILDHPDYKVGGPALVALVDETANNVQLRKDWHVKSRFRKRLDSIPELPPEQQSGWITQLIKAAGRSKMPIAKDVIRRGLTAKNPAVVRQSILAAGEQLQVEWIPFLINLGTRAEFLDLTIAALRQYDQALLNDLQRRLRPVQFSPIELCVIPKALARINQPESVNILLDLMEVHQPDNLQLRLESLRALRTLLNENEAIKIPEAVSFRMILTEAKFLETIVRALAVQSHIAKVDISRMDHPPSQEFITLLQRRTNGSVERLFLLLSMRYAPEDMGAAHHGIVDEDRAQRLRAIEYLDNLLELGLKRQVLPALEAFHRWSERSMEISKFSLESLLVEERIQIRRIMRRRDPRLKIAALRHAMFIADENYIPFLEHQLRAENETVRNLAQEIIEQLVV